MRNYTAGLLLFLGLWLGMAATAGATHIRAGEITATRQPGSLLTYNIVLTVYTDTVSSINEQSLTINFGDGNIGTARVDVPQPLILGAGTRVNVYRFTHTYPAPGRYFVNYVGVNRNQGVQNICNSSDNNFYIETMVTIDPFLGINNSPLLLKAPIDQGNLRIKYKHNPVAYDPDGDSLGYEILSSKIKLSDGRVVPATCYQDPAQRAGGLDSSLTSPARLTIDRTGTLLWDAPNLPGEFNVAIRITEWRFDTVNRRRALIGFVIRDMQILIRDSRNRPPFVQIPEDTCVLAGSPLVKMVYATDQDNNRVDLTANGGPFRQQPAANFSAVPAQLPVANGQFVWTPGCGQVRLQPWNVTFEARDYPAFLPRLVDSRTWNISVLGPRPTGVVATAEGGAIRVNWNRYTRFQCPNAELVDVYRRIDSVFFEPGACEVGMPPSLGYELVGTVSANDSTFLDTDKGKGLRPGRTYWYRLVARYPLPGLGESFVSEADSARLRLRSPLLYKTSVLTTDTLNGKIRLEWTQPLELDQVQYPGPYQYRLTRASLQQPNNFDIIYSSSNLTDTTFTDSLLNTAENAYQYKLFFSATNGAGQVLTDSTALAQSVYLTTESQPKSIALSWQASVPWSNAGRFHYIYKQGPSGSFALLDSVLAGAGAVTYVDDGSRDGTTMAAGTDYFYFVTTQGSYSIKEFSRPLLNNSQVQIGFVADTIAPCPPQGIGAGSVLGCLSCQELQGRELYNVIKWEADSTACDSDVVAYNIYFTAFEGQSPVLVGTVPATALRQFQHSDNGSLAGCYQIAAVDRSRNESGRTQSICVENCPAFDMPNVFTPNGDQYNETFRPQCYIPAFIQTSQLVIYNRWGQKLFASSVGQLEWNGELELGGLAPSGVYFYTAEIQFKNYKRNAPLTKIKGWVQLLR